MLHEVTRYSGKRAQIDKYSLKHHEGSLSKNTHSISSESIYAVPLRLRKTEVLQAAEK